MEAHEHYLMYREPVVEQCANCRHVEDYCNSYLYPQAKWRVGSCPLCSTTPLKPNKEEVFVDPIKKSKSKFKVKK